MHYKLKFKQIYFNSISINLMEIHQDGEKDIWSQNINLLTQQWITTMDEYELLEFNAIYYFMLHKETVR